MSLSKVLWFGIRYLPTASWANSRKTQSLPEKHNNESNFWMKLAYNSLPPFRKDEPQKLPFCYQFIQETLILH